jgi:hypothetical protein
MDQAILKLIAPGGCAKEFSDSVQLLLKHDWERAKREASLLRRLCEREPRRVKVETFKPGDRHDYRDYRERGWFLFAALLGVVGAVLLFGDLLFGVAMFGGVGIKGIWIWWGTGNGPCWKFVGVALLVGSSVIFYFKSKTRRSG